MTESSNSADYNRNNSSATIPIEEIDAVRGQCGKLLSQDTTSRRVSIMSSASSRSSMSDLCDHDETDLAADKPKIPDGGWGWVVVFSSLIISMIADGVSFSFGLLYIEFLKEFGASKSTTSWIGSLFMAVPLITGPIMSALVDKYGCRKMTIAGGLISATGFVISAFIDSIGWMLVTFGVIAGLGLGLCYVTAVVSIAYWFDKKRTLATGLGASGTGMGTFIYAPMTQFFIDYYGWRGTVLLLAGTFLNFCVCGCLMRDPQWWIEEQSKNTSKKTSSCASLSERSMPEDFPDLEEIRNLLKQSKNDEYLLQNLVTSMESPRNQNGGGKSDHHRSDFNLPTFVKQNEKVPIEVLEKLKANKKLYRVILENYPSLLMSRSTSDKALDTVNLHQIVTRVPVTFSMKLKKASEEPTSKLLVHQQSLPMEPLHEPLLMRKTSMEEKFMDPNVNSMHVPWIKKQFTSNHYYKNIRLHRNSIMYRGAMLNIRKYRIRASSCPNIYKNSMTTLAKESSEKWYTEFVELLKGIVDFSLFLELHFLLMSLSTILLFIWFIVPYFYLAEHLTSTLNYTQSEASHVISVIGITNTISMVALGWAGDQPWMNIKKTYAVCLVLCGLSCIGMYIFAGNYILLLVTSALFGLFFASSFSFTPVILVELIPLERFTTAYGLTLLCQGIGNLLGPPIGGLLFDVTQSWALSFYQAGLWIIVAGVLIAIIPFTKNRKIIGTGPVEKELMASERVSLA